MQPFRVLHDRVASPTTDHLALIQRAHADYFAAVTASAASEERMRPPGIHASEMSKCQRLFVYSMRGEPKTTKSSNAKMQQVFDIGKLVHAKVQRDFHKMAARSQGRVRFMEEVPIEPYTNALAKMWTVYSSADGLLEFWERNPETGAPHVILRVVVEIKTINPAEYTELKKPSAEHVEQTHLYMACLDAPLAWVLYVNKSNGAQTPAEPPWVYEFDDAVWAKLEERFDKAYDHVHLRTLPDREEGFGCEWCPYADACAPEYLKRKKSRTASKLSTIATQHLSKGKR